MGDVPHSGTYKSALVFLFEDVGGAVDGDFFAVEGGGFFGLGGFVGESGVDLFHGGFAVGGGAVEAFPAFADFVGEVDDAGGAVLEGGFDFIFHFVGGG